MDPSPSLSAGTRNWKKSPQSSAQGTAAGPCPAQPCPTPPPPTPHPSTPLPRTAPTLSSTTSVIWGSPSGFCMLAKMNWKPSRNSRSYRFFSSGFKGFHCSAAGRKKGNHKVAPCPPWGAARWDPDSHRAALGWQIVSTSLPSVPHPVPGLGTRQEERVRFRAAGSRHPPHRCPPGAGSPRVRGAEAQLTFLVAVLLLPCLALLRGQLVLLLFPRLLRLLLGPGGGRVLRFPGRGGGGRLVFCLRGTVTDLRLHGKGQRSHRGADPVPPIPQRASRPRQMLNTITEHQWPRHDGTKQSSSRRRGRDAGATLPTPGCLGDAHLLEGIQQVTHRLLLVQLLHPSLLLWHRHGDWRDVGP